MQEKLLALRAQSADSSYHCCSQIHLSTGSGLALLQQDCCNGFPPKIGTKMGFNPIAAPTKHRECFLPQEGKRETGSVLESSNALKF